MGNPDFVYNPDDWEYTYCWSDRELLTEDMRAGDVMRVSTLISGPDKFAAQVVVTRDEAGDPENIELRWYDTEAEAVAASKQ